MFNLNQKRGFELSSGKKERSRSRPHSRNALTSARTTAVLTLSKSIRRSISPGTRTSTQRSNKTNSTLNTREKSLIKQNLQLKKDNEKLMLLLKKSKAFIKDEIAKYRPENLIMKKFALTVWSWVESELDEKLKEEIKPIINREHNIKTLSFRSKKIFSGIEEELSLLKSEVEKKSNEILILQKKLNHAEQLNKSMMEYMNYMEKNTKYKEEKNIEDIIYVDSSNLISDEGDEEIHEFSKGPTVPGFVKSLQLARK